ncbi:MAG: hypothetical protein NVSMB69_15680 [Novosphingobium sp.]
MARPRNRPPRRWLIGCTRQSHRQERTMTKDPEWLVETVDGKRAAHKAEALKPAG